MAANDSDESVIIVAPVGQDASAMATRLNAQGIATEICSSLIECAAKMIRGAGALVLTEEAWELPNVSDLLDTLKSQPPWSEISVIVLTGSGEPRLSKLLDSVATAARSITLLERPISSTTLLRSVQVALRSRRRQYQVRNLIEEQERVSRIKDEFLATISHELRTPLNAILGWATLLSGAQLDKVAFDRAIKAIERNAKSQAQLVEDLLDVSRIISGKLRLEIKPVVIANVVRAAVDAVRPAADAKQVKLQLTVDNTIDQLRADEARLQQIIWNLLSNSIKFTPSGGLVRLAVARADSVVEISISDTGEGINKQLLPFIFDRFQQGDASITRKHGGLGLGLAITRHLVEMHGGTIEADSNGEGLGATFCVRLPMAQAATAGRRVRPNLNSASQVPVPDAPDLSGVRILAVDDAEDTRALLHFVLEHYGADVITAGSAQDAMEVLERWQPDVIVCDIGMPDEDGYSFIRRVRQLRQGGDTPAVAVTGYVRVEDRMRALDAGYQMFVPKPVQPMELVSLIASVTGRAAEPTLG